MKKILIIEDDPTLVKILQLRLAREGIEILVEVNPEEGFRRIKGERPDLVILDLYFPHGTPGLRLLQKIKTIQATRDIPVLVFSVAGRAETIKEALELGASDYVIKGTISIDELVDKVKKVLER